MITNADIPDAPAFRTPIAVSGENGALLCGLSSRTWRRLDAQGLVPRAVRIGCSKRRAVAELEARIEADCPVRARWQSRKKVAVGSHGRR